MDEQIELLIAMFTRVRRRFGLGVDELRTALRLLDGGWSFDGEDRLREDLRMLWSPSSAALDRQKFDDEWAAAVAERQRLKPKSDPPVTPPSTPPLEPARAADREPPPPAPQREANYEEAERESPPPAPGAPIPLPTEEPAEMNAHWPLSRRSMLYGWRYLREMAADGPENILDLETTIEQVARGGVYRGPVHRRRESNHARIAMLIDCGGSMAPFHRFTRDLVASARQSGEFAPENVEAWYFHNTAADHLCETPSLTGRRPVEDALRRFDAGTAILIVSDAGAARGMFNPGRVAETTAFLARLKQHTSLIAWLNPMPAERWAGTPAQVISFLAPMLPMDQDGFGRAVDVMRGIAMRSLV